MNDLILLKRLFAISDCISVYSVLQISICNLCYMMHPGALTFIFGLLQCKRGEDPKSSGTLLLSASLESQGL